MMGAADVSREGVQQCTRCRSEPRMPGQRYGRVCHAAYMREWRARHPSPRALRRAAAIEAIRALPALGGEQ